LALSDTRVSSITAFVSISATKVDMNDPCPKLFIVQGGNWLEGG